MSAESAERVAFVVLCVGFAAASGGFATHTPLSVADRRCLLRALWLLAVAMCADLRLRD